MAHFCLNLEHETVQNEKKKFEKNKFELSFYGGNLLFGTLFLLR